MEGFGKMCSTKRRRENPEQTAPKHPKQIRCRSRPAETTWTWTIPDPLSRIAARHPRRSKQSFAAGTATYVSPAGVQLGNHGDREFAIQ